MFDLGYSDDNSIVRIDVSGDVVMTLEDGKRLIGKGDFIWDPRSGCCYLNKVEIIGEVDEDNIETDEEFEKEEFEKETDEEFEKKLEEYKLAREEYKLAIWCEEQQRLYRQGKLKEWQIKKLEELSFWKWCE